MPAAGEVVRERLGRLVDWALRSEGSTISLSLIRMGLAMLIWTRWANEMLLYRHRSFPDMAFVALFFVATTLMLIGWKSRVWTAVTALCLVTIYYYYGFARGRESWTHHHTYLLTISTCLLALGPSAGVLSVDAYLAQQRDRFRRANLWTMRLIAVQLSAMYFWTATNKSKWGWINGDRMEHYLMYYYTGSNYDLVPMFGVAMLLLANFVLLLEYALVFGLYSRRGRRYLVPLGILLHLSFYAMLPVSTFSTTVLLLYLVFYDPDDIERGLRGLLG